MSKKQTKVLSVCTSDSLGGAARAAYRIHCAVRDYDKDCRMFVKHKNTNDSDVLCVYDFVPHNLAYQGLNWVRNKCKNKIQHYIWGKYPDREGYYMSDLRSMNIGQALDRIDYDILHLHWINQRFIPLEQLPKNKPIVWTLHDSWPFCGVCHYPLDCKNFRDRCGNCPHLASNNNHDLSNRIWQKKAHIYKHLDLHIVTPSQWLGLCAKESSLLCNFPISVIPNCVETLSFRPLVINELSPRWKVFIERKNTPFVLYGAMNAIKDEIKGFSNLLSALSILKDSGNANLELIVIGADKPLDGLSDIITTHYLGHIEDERELVSLYNLASVVVVPSHTENLSCTIMESMACGTPVVAFELGGNGDMIDHMKNGYLAKRLDSEDFAAGIVWCLENNKHGELSENARKKVLRCFTPQVVGRKYLQLYSSLI